MARDGVDQRTGVLDVLGSTADNGEVRASLGLYQQEQGIDAAAPVWGPPGFISRPLDPDSTGSAFAFYLQSANRRYVLAVKDKRYADKVGTLQPGDAAIVTPNGEARLMVKHDRDAVVIYTENAAEELSMMIDVSGADGVITMLNGNAFMRMANDEITLGVNGGASLTLKADGTAQVDGAVFNAATGAGCLGKLAPAPYMGHPPPAFSVLFGPTGMAGVASTSWTIAP